MVNLITPSYSYLAAAGSLAPAPPPPPPPPPHTHTQRIEATSIPLRPCTARALAPGVLKLGVLQCEFTAL